MADEKQDFKFHSNDPESQENKALYETMVASIKHALDPDANAVLIVDDERGIRKSVSRSIKRTDPTIMLYEAENGLEGLQVLAQIREKHKKDPLLIVTDLHMPVMDGWQFIEELRKEYEAKGKKQGIPLIVLSSTTGEKGIAFFRKSVHGGKSGYHPLASVAKEVCLDPAKYDAFGEKGLVAWLRHFMK